MDPKITLNRSRSPQMLRPAAPRPLPPIPLPREGRSSGEWPVKAIAGMLVAAGLMTWAGLATNKWQEQEQRAENLEATIQQARSDQMRIENQLAAVEDAFKRSKTTIRSQGERISTVIEEKDQVAGALDATQAQAGQLNNALQATSGQLSNLQTTLHQKEGEHAAKEEALRKMADATMDEAAEARTKAAALAANLNQTAAEAARHENNARQLADDLQTTKNERDSARQEGMRYQAEASTLHSRVSSLESEKASLESCISSLRSDISRLQSEVQTLRSRPRIQ